MNRRLMKIKYPKNDGYISRLKTCLDMVCAKYVIFDDFTHYLIYIDRNKCTWNQIMKEVNRVHATKFDFARDVYIKNGELCVDCGTVHISQNWHNYN